MKQQIAAMIAVIYVRNRHGKHDPASSGRKSGTAWGEDHRGLRLGRESLLNQRSKGRNWR